MTHALVVDDNGENLYMLRALLQGNGFTVDEASNGADALARAGLARPDLIISDLLMPVMDGYTLLRRWKADEVLSSIPFIVYTATYTDPKDQRLALDLGADAFILKPAEPDTFMARLRRVLDQRSCGESNRVSAPPIEETVLLKEYSEVLVRKLEKKAFELEEANRALKADLAERKRAEELYLAPGVTLGPGPQRRARGQSARAGDLLEQVRRNPLSMDGSRSDWPYAHGIDRSQIGKFSRARNSNLTRGNRVLGGGLHAAAQDGTTFSGPRVQ